MTPFLIKISFSLAKENSSSFLSATESSNSSVKSTKIINMV